MNVLLNGLSNAPFFASEISWVWLALFWDSWSTWTEMTCFGFEEVNDNEPLSARGLSLSRQPWYWVALNAGTERREVMSDFCFECYKRQTRKRCKSLACSSPGVHDGVSEPLSSTEISRMADTRAPHDFISSSLMWCSLSHPRPQAI